MQVKYHTTERFPPMGKEVLVEVLRETFGPDPVQMVRSAPGPGVVCFQTPAEPLHGGILAPTPMQVAKSPGHRYMLRAALLASQGVTASEPLWGDRTLFFDIESHSVDDRWRMDPREFFRLGQYAWGFDGTVNLTTDYDEMISVIREANGVVGHNIHAFDLSVLFGKDSVEPLEMARDGKVFDTMVFANLAFPAPDTFTTRLGHTYRDAAKPRTALKWLGLDNLSFQLGLEGKIGDLKALAKKYDGFGQIPTDDPEFVEYARQDVTALQDLTKKLLLMKTPDAYDRREQVSSAIDCQMSRNGFRVDIPKAQERVETLRKRKEEVLKMLEEKYDFPTSGKSPWATTAGKQAILKALADAGVVPEDIPNWTRTATGNISLGGEVLREFTVGTEAEDLGAALAELKGQRSLAQLALDSVQPDGKVHPEINALQRSSRRSVTDPGLTVWSARAGGGVEKDYFIASEGRKLVELDYSAADARVVAACSGDTEFSKRFEPGVDAHDLTGVIFFGEERYYANRDELRPLAKAGGHSMAYRVGTKKLASMLDVSESEAASFIRAYQEAYPLVYEWQERVTKIGESGSITNDWGRRMQVEPSRSFTQSSALMGQSGTASILVDGLLRMLGYDLRLIQWCVAPVHDALVFDVPEEHLEWAVPKIRELMECSWGPSDGTGQIIEFPVSSGEPSRTWREAGH